MGNSFFVWYLITLALGVVIWFFLNRASVRANRQIELLEEISNKLSALSGVEITKETKNKSAENYLEEARKNAGLK